MLSEQQKRNVARKLSYTVAAPWSVFRYSVLLLPAFVFLDSVLNLIELLSRNLILSFAVAAVWGSAKLYLHHYRRVAHQFHPGEFLVLCALNLPPLLIIGHAWLNDLNLGDAVTLQYMAELITVSLQQEWQAYRYHTYGGSIPMPLLYKHTFLPRQLRLEIFFLKRMGFDSVSLGDSTGTGSDAESRELVAAEAGLLPAPSLVEVPAPRPGQQSHVRGTHQAKQV